MSETVQVIRTEHDGVVEVRLNRPDKMNAISTEMFADLIFSPSAKIFGDFRDFCRPPRFSPSAKIFANGRDFHG